MIRLKMMLTALALMAAGLSATIARAADYPLQIGAAVRDITPKPEWLPLEATGRTTAVAVIDPVHVRAIALSNGSDPVLMMMFEAGGPPAADPYQTGLSEHTGIPTDRIYFGGTHAHTTPSTDVRPDNPGSQPFHDYVYDQMIAAADEALANMKPGQVEIGYGTSYINVNRQAEFIHADGKVEGAQGYNPTGPSDKTLAVVRFSDLQDNPIAFVVHYAVHNTAMYANRYNAEGVGISADIGGAVSRIMETAFPGSVAMWMPGTAGDQNPLISNEYFTPDPDTGAQQTNYMEAANTALLDFYGKVQFADVQKALKNIVYKTDSARISMAYGGATLPPYTRGKEPWPIRLKLLRIGQIAFVGNPTELFNTTGMYIKAHSPLRYTLVSNQNRTFDPSYNGYTSYMPDDYAIEHDGWHTNAKNYATGSIDATFARLLNELIAQTE